MLCSWLNERGQSVSQQNVYYTVVIHEDDMICQCWEVCFRCKITKGLFWNELRFFWRLCWRKHVCLETKWATRVPVSRIRLSKRSLRETKLLLAGESNPALPRSDDGGFRQWQAGISAVCTAILTDILARIWWFPSWKVIFTYSVFAVVQRHQQGISGSSAPYCTILWYRILPYSLL